MSLSNLSFKHKVIALITIPLLAFLWVSSVESLRNYQVSSSMKELAHLTELAQVYSQLVHELQKERGATAGFIGSKGSKFQEKLTKQRKDSDSKLQARIHFLNEHTFNQPQIVKVNQLIAQSTKDINNIRQQVDNLTIDLSSALKFYTQLNEKLLSVPSLITQLSKDPEISREVTAYYNFLQGKERAGIERAVLSNTFAQNKFAPNMYKKFITLVSEQQTYFNNFTTFSKPENQTFYTNSLQNDAVIQVMKMRKIAFANAFQGGFDIEPVYWFEQATGRISQLKKIEDHLSKHLLLNSQSIAESAQNTMFLNIILSCLVFFIAISNGFYIIRGLTAQVDELVHVMSKVRNNNDLAIRVQSLPKNELGEIGRSLNLTLEVFSNAIQEISASSVTLSAAAEQTSQTCSHNSTSMNQQQEQIALIATAIEELSATIKDVAHNTQLTSDSAREADSLSKNGLHLTQESYLAIEALAEEITHLSEKITHLHDSSSKITGVVDVIKSVAEQTNLLALNAAIEAARAGEQGRGFAVVADEVRTLAQRTQDSTSEIEDFISDLTNNANAAYNVIEESKNKASKAVENSRNVENSLESITGAIDTIVSMSEQVATAVEQQATVARDVAHNIVNVENKSMESATDATQIAETAKEQAHLATSLQAISNTFKVN